MAIPESEEGGVESGWRERVRSWVLLKASRWAVAGVLAAALFLALAGIGAFGPPELQAFLTQRRTLASLLQSLITPLLTGVTVVLTINQLVLSQELGAAEDQRERMDGALTFQRDAEAVVGPDVSPAEPSAFLGALVRAAREHGDRLEEGVATGDRERRRRVEEFVAELRDRALAVEEGLDGAEFGTFGVLEPALEFDYSALLYQLRRISPDDETAQSGEGASAYDDLFETLTLFGVAREHFKTLYFQWELINLSRAVMYTLLPSLAVAVSGVLFLDVEAVTGSTLGVDHLLLVTSATITITVLPFVILIAFLLRIGTMAKRTLAIGPFVLRETSDDEALDGE